MTGSAPSPAVDAYIAAAPEAVRPMLAQMRALVHSAAPDAREMLSYGMPAYKGRHMLVYFAAWKNHLGFYPTAGGITRFQAELAGYKISKGAVQFPYSAALPEVLIQTIVRFRVEEDRQ